MESQKEKAVDPQVKYYPHLKLKKRCVVPTCPTKYYKILDTTIDFKNHKFMGFPANFERRKRWCEILKNETGIELDYEHKIKKVICSNHFQKKYLIASGRISWGGFPSLFPLEIEEETPSYIQKEVAPTSSGNVTIFKYPKKWQSVFKKSIKMPLGLKDEENRIMYLKKFISITTGNKCQIFNVSETTVQNKLEFETSNQESTSSSIIENEARSHITENSVSRIINTVNSSHVKNSCNDVRVTTQQLNEYHPLVDHNYYNSSATESPSISFPDKSVTCLSSFPESYTVSVSPVYSSISIEQSRKLKRRRVQKQKAVVLKKKLKEKLLSKKYGKNTLAWQIINNRKSKAQILDEKDVFNLAKCNKPWCPLEELRNALIMPYGLTLKSLLCNIPINSGINPVVVNRLKRKVTKMKEINKCCMLLFKTMPLASRLEYCKEGDQILGYQDFNISEKATSALVFMVQGLKKPWKQPVAYYFAEHLSAKMLAKLVTNVITMLQDSGLCVIGTLCNHNQLNRLALRHLYQENNRRDSSNTFKSRSPYFVVNNHKIITMYDSSTLLVSTRNVLLKYDIEYEPQKFAYFNDIIHSYNVDKKRCYQKLSKLRQKDLLLRSNNVSVAAKTLSYSIASCIELGLGIQGENTALFIRNMDLLFDGFNSRKKSTGRIRSPNNRHGRPLFWKRMIKFINQWVFHEKINGGIKSCLPLKSSWITTIRAAQMLEKICRAKGFKSYGTNSLNLDPLQNFLASIRYFGTRNRKPTPYEFVDAFKLSALNNLILPFNAKSNCLKDEGIILDNYQDLFKPPSKKSLMTEEDRIENCLVPLLEESELQISNMNNEFNRVAEINRFLLQKLDLSCEICKSSTVLDNLLFECLNSNDGQIPFLVTGGFGLFVTCVYHIVMYVLDRYGWLCNIRRNLRDYLEKNLDFEWFQCKKHKNKFKSRLVNLCILLLIKEKLKV